MRWTEVFAFVAAAAAVGTPVWAWTRYPVLVVHEAGHALTAVLTGARDVRVRIGVGSGGLTEWESDENHGPGATAAGFPAPGAVGLAALAGLHYGSTAWVLWGVLGLLGAVAVIMRSWFGASLLVLCAAPVYGVLRYLPDGLQVAAVLALAWTLLAGGVRSALQDAEVEGSDCDLIVEAVGGSRTAWYFLFLLVALAQFGAATYLTAVAWA